MSNKGLWTCPLEASDREIWDGLATRHGCLFDSLRWTDMFGPRLLRVGIFDAGAKLRGGFCVWEERRLGLKILRNPPYTAQIGPFFELRASNPAAKTDEQRAVVQAMAEYLRNFGAAVVSLGLSLGITDALPFYWQGWKVVPHFTYLIDLTHGDDDLLAALSKERRNDISKAQRDGLQVDSSTDTAPLRELMMQTFSRQGKAFSLASADRLFSAFPPGQQSCCMIASANGRPMAGVYVVHDARTAYYLMGGYADGAHHGAGALAMWRAILKAKELGLEVFDFEGSVVPPIERYFRGFGGQLTPILSVHRAWLPLEMALKLYRRQWF